MNNRYTYWHRDYGREGQGQQWNWCFDHPTLSEDVKLFFCISDTTEEQGPTAIVPGTVQTNGLLVCLFVCLFVFYRVVFRAGCPSLSMHALT